MTNKDRMYTLFFIFAILSITLSTIAKLVGFDLFRLNQDLQFVFMADTIKFFVLAFQYILIVGCVTRFEFKELMFKMLPYIPLTVILFYLPKDMYLWLCAVIMISTCLSLVPKFSTIIRFFLNVVFICVLQLVIIWLRLDVKQLLPVFPSLMDFIIMNIDQFIILSLLYYINRKGGIVMGWFFLGKANKKTFLSRLRKFGDVVCAFFKG